MDTPTIPYAMEVSLKRYGVDRWGEEFLTVNDEGHLVFPSRVAGSERLSWSVFLR